MVGTRKASVATQGGGLQDAMKATFNTGAANFGGEFFRSPKMDQGSIMSRNNSVIRPPKGATMEDLFWRPESHQKSKPAMSPKKLIMNTEEKTFDYPKYLENHEIR